MSIFQNLVFSKEYIWTLHCICKDYYTFVFLVYASFLTIQNTFFPNILSTMKGKHLHKAYIHAYVCEILNADTHTNTYTHPYIYSLSEKYLLFLSIMLRGFVFLCIFFSENGNCDKTFILQFLSTPYTHAATISGVQCTS